MRLEHASLLVVATLLVFASLYFFVRGHRASAAQPASETLLLASELIARPSVTPDDAGCTAILVKHLHAMGFTTEALRFGDVSNLWAVYGAPGSAGPLFVFAGHTDVVPVGDERLWRSPPFSPTIRDGALYGRGATDMKGALAAMVIATKRFLQASPEIKGRIGFLLTSNEEGIPGLGHKEDGTKRMMAYLKAKGVHIDACVVGEPTSEKKFGDVIKHGRRGSLTGTLQVQGVQGHAAYPERAQNPIHRTMAALAELAATKWDEGNLHFQPTGLQIVDLHSGTGAANVIPGSLVATFNFRFSPSVSADELKAKTHAIFDRMVEGAGYDITWKLNAEPFLTSHGDLVPHVQEAISEVTGVWPECTTGGGTSDARFIAGEATQVIEFGTRNNTIHAVDEHVAVDELEELTLVYQKILDKTLRPVSDLRLTEVNRHGDGKE